MSDEDKLWAVDPGLAAAYLKVRAAFAVQYPNARLGVAQGFRTPSMQAVAASTGASSYDGTTSWSFHQLFPSGAIDFAVFAPDGTGPGGYVENGADGRYAWVGHTFEGLGFIWGARFHSRPDYDHVQTRGHGPRSPGEAAQALGAYQAALSARGVTA